MRRVGVLGSGSVGQVLAQGLKALRYEGRIASRTPAKLSTFSTAAGIQAGTFAEVAAWAELVVLAVLGSAAVEALAEAGRDSLSGKIVIDTTNPISQEPADRGVLQFFTGPNESLMERLQAEFATARFVKGFNSVGHALMINPQFREGRPTMFYCGDDVEAKAVVADIIRDLGWEGADMGTAASARALEPLCQLWCLPGFLENRWEHAFRLLRR